MFKLCVSNIGWKTEDDSRVYGIMKDLGYEGLEIAPTRIYPERPYDRCSDAAKWSEDLFGNYGLRVASMQSIWYGRQEKLFNSIQERKVLTDYTKKAIEFAEAVGCNNLVFGCPRNRVIKEEADKENAILFFREIGDYASEHHTVVAIEANPPIYNTNYINDTESALDLIGQVDSKGFLLNLDVGTMIENNEEISVLYGKEHLINHVHISEPNLKRIEERDVHGKLASFLTGCDYGGYVSIEVGRQDDVSSLEEMMLYVRRIFGEQL